MNNWRITLETSFVLTLNDAGQAADVASGIKAPAPIAGRMVANPQEHCELCVRYYADDNEVSDVWLEEGCCIGGQAIEFSGRAHETVKRFARRLIDAEASRYDSVAIAEMSPVRKLVSDNLANVPGGMIGGEKIEQR